MECEPPVWLACWHLGVLWWRCTHNGSCGYHNFFCLNSLLQTKSQNHQMVIQWPLGDFLCGIGVFRIRDWGFKSQIPNPKNTNTQFKITKWLILLLFLHCLQKNWMVGNLNWDGDFDIGEEVFIGFQVHWTQPTKNIWQPQSGWILWHRAWPDPRWLWWCWASYLRFRYNFLMI